MAKYIHKYAKKDIWNIYSKCGVLALNCGTYFWKKVTCPKCLKDKDR